MANGMTRIVNAELVRKGVKKGKALKDQLAEEFSPSNVAATRPENQPKKKTND